MRDTTPIAPVITKLSRQSCTMFRQYPPEPHPRSPIYSLPSEIPRGKPCGINSEVNTRLRGSHNIRVLGSRFGCVRASSCVRRPTISSSHPVPVRRVFQKLHEYSCLRFEAAWIFLYFFIIFIFLFFELVILPELCYNTIQLYCLCVEKFAFWFVIYIKTLKCGCVWMCVW